jgi:predicted ATPase/class 3 adenylate cyclase
MNCTHCQAANAENARFCSSCGSPLAAPPRVEGERKLVTVLFADVVGSTTMGERLDPEEITEIMNGAFAVFNGDVSRYGGTVSRLLGDAVLAIFGAPVAHEDDAERAVMAGLAIQGSARTYAARVAERYAVDFQVRVGIHTGLAVLTVVGDTHGSVYTAMGDAVNVAARMQSAARTGTVLVSADTFHLIKGAFEMAPQGAMEVKGKSAPIETYEVLAVSATPQKKRGLPGMTSPLVGRDGELATLRTASQETLAGHGSFLAIVGEAGLGKSRLIAELRTRCGVGPPAARDHPQSPGELGAPSAGAGPTWLEGHAYSYGETSIYSPWREVVRQAIGVIDADPPQAVRERLRAGWAERELSQDDLIFLETLLGVESEETLAAVGQFQRVQVAEGITRGIERFLAALAATAPLILVFEDLHWADEATLELITAITRLTATSPLLIVGIMRPDRAALSWSTLQRIETVVGDRFARIELEPLSAEFSQTLLGNLLHIEDLPASVRALMLRKSEGNPFFLEEIIRSLIDSGHIVRENAHWRATGAIADVAIPDTLLGLLTARIDRLPDPTKQVAQTAAVIGRMFSYPVLAAVSAPERSDDLHPDLQTLTLEQLVREWNQTPELEYIFKHALMQEAAYDLLLLRRRREFHCRVGAALESLYPRRLGEMAPLIARHFWLGENWSRAARYAMQAGEEAERAGAPAEASNQYDRAYQSLKKLPDAKPEDTIDAILSWVRTAYKLEAAESVLERLCEAESLARALDDKRRLALTLNWIGNVYFGMGVPSGGVPALVEGYRLAEELGEEELVIGWTFLISESVIDQCPQAALPYLDRIIEIARKNYYDDIEAHAIAMKAMTYGRLGRFAEAREALRASEELVEKINSPVKVADVHSAAAFMYYDMGEMERGIRHSLLAADVAGEVGGYECSLFGSYAAGVGYLQQGTLQQARQAFEDAVRLADLSTIGSEWLKNRILAGLAMARAQLGEAAATPDMEERLTKTRDFQDDYTAAQLSHALGDCYIRLGDLEQARAHLDSALDYYRRNDMRPYLPRILASIAALREQEGQADGAIEARDEAARVTAELVG